MQIQDSAKAPNAFVRVARKVYHPIGFKKGYNFSLFVILVGALLGFSLARLQYTFAFSHTFCGDNRDIGAAKGECYYYGQHIYKVGIKLHLYTILPAAVLACLQFVPRIRHRVILFHRINGYLVLTLVFFGLIGALLIARRAFGGGLDTQSYIGVLFIMSATSLSLSYYNVKKLQIEEHRKWMLRAWAYLGTIITMRFIFVIMAVIISQRGQYYQPRACAQVRFIIQNDTLFAEQYPQCLANASIAAPGGVTLVHANITSTRNEEVGAALGTSFGPSAWLALILHTFLVELYLYLTPAEHARLRNVSYQRQLEAGKVKPGNAGLTVQRLGDANPWVRVDEHGQSEVVTFERAQVAKSGAVAIPSSVSS